MGSSVPETQTREKEGSRPLILLPRAAPRALLIVDGHGMSSGQEKSLKFEPQSTTH